MEATHTPKARHWTEYVFCMLVGSLYIYSLNRVIISATFIRTSQFNLFAMGAVSLAFFILIFYNRMTRIISGAVFAFCALIIFFTFERWERQAEHLYEVTRMVRGYMFYRPELGTTVLWAISLLFGLVVAVFMLYRFSFYLLAVTGVAIFLFTWGPGFTRDMQSFLIFLVCFCLLLIRKTNKSLSAVYVAAPICAALVLFVQGSMPMEAEMFQRRTLRELFDGPLAAVGDLIHIMTNPMYFSFQSTGFSGQGGRLGGPVTPNNRNVMTVMAPGRTYLAGATHNTYTGYSWISTLEPGQLYTQGMHPSQFEMLETMTALIRNASRVSDSAFISVGVLASMFPDDDRRLLLTDHFPALGIEYGAGVGRAGQTGFAMNIPRPGVTIRYAYVSLDDGSESRVIEMTGQGHMTNVQAVDIPVAISGAGAHIAALPSSNMMFEVERQLRYLHAYLPMNQVTIAIGTNRTGTVFRPQNSRSISFHPAGPDYLHSLMFDPSGDILAPGFMARGTQYTLGFLNVDQRLSFVNDMAGQSFQGFYEMPSEVVIYMFALDGYLNNGAVQELLDLYNAQDPNDYLCNLTYVTLKYYVTNLWDGTPDREFTIRAPKDMFDFTPYDITVTAQDMNDLFDMFAYQGANRILQYVESHTLLMAKLDSFSQNVLARYAETVRENFMYIPEIVPQRVHDLVNEIIYGLETDYERIMAIRDYLVRFTYTFTPQPVPPGVCFVDHFLFVGQEGYCTYYASAMAIMSRIAGIPSRYVEGFLLPAAPPEADGEIAIFVVTNMMAHAWVEVYLEGFGWLIVEATAPYAFVMDPALTLPAGNLGNYWPMDGMLYMDDFYHLMQGHNPMMPGGPAQSGPVGDDIVLEGGVFTQQMRMIMLAVLLGMAVLMLGFMLIQYIKVMTVTRRVNRLPVNQRITTYFTGIIDIASYVTSAKEPTETPYVYGQRVGMRFAFKNDSARLRDLVTLYYRARYGSLTLTEEESMVMEDSYFDMVNYLRMEHRKSRFFYLRYILRIGAL